VRLQLQGTFYLQGHYQKKQIDNFQWTALYGKKLKAIYGCSDYGWEWAKKYPAFRVTSWCFRRRKLSRSQQHQTTLAIRKAMRKGWMKYSDFCSHHTWRRRLKKRRSR